MMDDDEMQQFNLRWHNHQSSLISSLGRLYTSGALTDVILSANGTTMKAHKLVLASCSQYFADLFKEVDNDNSTLVVVLSCEASELHLLLSFMYTGEVTASRKALPPLLRLARALRVAGLTHADCTNPSNSPTDQEMKQDEYPPTSPMNLEVNKPETQRDNTIDNLNTFRYTFDDYAGNIDKETIDNGASFAAKSEERLSKLDQIVQNLYSTHKLDSPIVNVPVTPPIVSNFEETAPPFDRKYRSHSVCHICKKRLSNQYNLRVHMETHAGGRHACRACDHVSRSRDALRKHVAYRHPNVAGLRGDRRD